MKLCQFFIQANFTVPFALTAFFFLQTITAIFTLIKFFCSAIFVSSYRSAVKIMKLFSVRTYWIAICIYRKIYCSVRIISLFFVLAFLFIHSKFHVFFHAVFFTIQIIIKAAVSCVCYRIFRIFFVYLIELFYQRLEMLMDYNKNPYDIEASKITFAEVFEKLSAEKFPTISDSNAKAYKASYNTCNPCTTECSRI